MFTPNHNCPKITIEFTRKGTIINADGHLETLMKLHRTMKNKIRGYVLSTTNSPSRLSKGHLLYTQHCPCSRHYILNKSPMLRTFQTYHLVDYSFFGQLKITLQGHTFHLDEHLREVVKVWVNNNVGGEIWFRAIFDLFPR